MLDRVVKRDSRVVPFDSNKIFIAITKASEAVGGSDDVVTGETVDYVLKLLQDRYESSEDIPHVEDIQNTIEWALIKRGHAKTAKEFIIYRHNRTMSRDMNAKLMETVKDLTFKDSKDNDLKRENGNIDGNTSMGMMLKFGSETSKTFATSYIVHPRFARAHKEGYIHIHDLDFYATGTTTCVSPNTIVEVGGKYLRAKEVTLDMVGSTLRSGQKEETLLNVIPSRKDKIINIYAKGYSLEVTPEHRIPTLNRGLVFASDIRVGDVLDVNTSTGWLGTKNKVLLSEIYDISDWIIDERGARPHGENQGQRYKNKLPLEIPLDRGMGRLLGFVASEGTVSIKEDSGEVCFVNNDDTLINEVEGLWKKYFPECTVSVYNHSNGCKKVLAFGKLVVGVINFFLDKKSAYDMELNSVFFDADKEFALGFLSGYLDGDGNNYYPWRLTWMGTCLPLIRDISRLLLAMGYRNTLKTDRCKGTLAHWKNHKDSIRTRDILKDEVTGSDYDSLCKDLWDSIKVSKYSYVPHNRRDKGYGVVREINVSDYEGNVYDFTSSDHYFNADFVRVHNCLQIPLDILFHNGFSTGHGYLREPTSIGTAGALAAIAIQANQNDQHGGQSIPLFDYYLAPYVAKSFIKNLISCLKIKFDSLYSVDLTPIKNELNRYFNMVGTVLSEGVRYNVKPWIASEYGLSVSDVESCFYKAVDMTDRDTYQAMEGFIHNLNTMHSRAGAQVPFSSINYGTCTSPEGRMIIENLLKATEAGLGNGETPIFPVQIFKVKEGINLNEDDVNYDLFKLACRVSAKRLFPNFSFIDAPFNLQGYKGTPETEVGYMGCRTRVFGNVNDPSKAIVPRRGNLSFTSINLPRLAIESHGNLDIFMSKLDMYLDLCYSQLLERFRFQCKKQVKNFPFLMGQGLWLDSEKLTPEDTLEEVLKHGTLSIGFIGLAECLISLTGLHHGESVFAQDLGLKIVSHMREFCDNMSIKSGLNITCLATPAEGLSGRFVRMDRERYGEIKGVTDKDYYTNSFHVPVYYQCTPFHKIEIEAPYHSLTNAGHISYIEMDGDPSQNLEAFEEIIRFMAKSGIGYGSINHPVDRDPVCGYVGIINDVCPRCGRHNFEDIPLGSFDSEDVCKCKEEL